VQEYTKQTIHQRKRKEKKRKESSAAKVLQ
jgi:hypothetical protein